MGVNKILAPNRLLAESNMAVDESPSTDRSVGGLIPKQNLTKTNTICTNGGVTPIDQLPIRFLGK
jgi:hypothetical protein